MAVLILDPSGKTDQAADKGLNILLLNIADEEVTEI